MMNKQYRNFCLLLAVIFTSPAVQASDDVSEIQAVIQKYFDGTSQGRPELLRQAFAPSLELQHVGKEGELSRWLGTDYIARFKPGVTNGRVGNLLAVDITGDAATAKAEIVSGNRVFTDYFLLLKLKDGWRITNKIFTRRAK